MIDIDGVYKQKDLVSYVYAHVVFQLYLLL